MLMIVNLSFCSSGFLDCNVTSKEVCEYKQTMYMPQYLLYIDVSASSFCVLPPPFLFLVHIIITVERESVTKAAEVNAESLKLRKRVCHSQQTQ